MRQDMSRGRKPKDRNPYVPDPTDNLFPEHEWDYVNVAAERVKLAWENHHFMNPDGRKMLLAFSGGKDSVCLFFVAKQVAEEMGLRLEDICHVQYNVTTVDPPELVYFVRDVMKRQYPYIEMRHPEKTMWDLIVEKHQPPLRNSRYCCAILKESSKVRGGGVYAYGCPQGGVMEALVSERHRDPRKHQGGEISSQRQRRRQAQGRILYAEPFLCLQPDYRLDR